MPAAPAQPLELPELPDEDSYPYARDVRRELDRELPGFPLACVSAFSAGQLRSAHLQRRVIRSYWLALAGIVCVLAAGLWAPAWVSPLALCVFFAGLVLVVRAQALANQAYGQTRNAWRAFQDRHGLTP